MKNITRFLGVFLIVSFFSLSAFALSVEKQAADFLADKGYIVDHRGETEEYRVDDGITRKEMMKIIAKINGEELEDTCATPFSDVSPDDWGCKYITWALERDFIAQNEQFRPEDNINITEALKLIFKAKGIEKAYDTGNWQDDYINTAFDLGLIDEHYTNYVEEASRGWIFLVAANTFEEFEVADEDEILIEDESLQKELEAIFDLFDESDDNL